MISWIVLIAVLTFTELFVLPLFSTAGRKVEFEAAVLELRSLVNSARTTIDDSGEDVSDSESDAGANSSNKPRALDEIASDIKFYNLRLMDLLPSIERTALAVKEIPESEMDTTHNSVPFKVSKPAYAYVLQVRDKFPQADNKLMERLGEANWQRRLRIREKPDESVGVAAVETAKSIFMPVSMFHDSGLGTSIPSQSSYAATAVSYSSFRTTATENQVGTYRVPPTPREVFDDVPFTCEICGHLLRNIKSRVDWK